MTRFYVDVKHHLTVDVTYEIEAEDEKALDEALKENSPCDLGHVFIENPPEETHLEILEVHKADEVDNGRNT